MHGFSLWLLFACTETSEDTGVIIEIRPDSEPIESETAEELQDIDSDGFLEDVDCDDWNPNIFPGAEEMLNNEDDDCDGYVDADGLYDGIVDLQAVAIYQGDPYSFLQTCTATVERVVGQVGMNIVCEIDQSQDRANQLLGGSITITATENFVFEDSGTSRANFESTSGEMEWDALGDANWSWSSWEENKSSQLETQVVLDALHLDILITGTLNRQ